MTRRAASFVAAAFAANLLASPALGEEPLAVLAVAPPPGPGPELVLLAGALRAALGGRSPDVLGAEAVRERMSVATPPPALPELDRALAGALAAHAAGDFEPANRTLRAVVDALEALPDGPEVHAARTRAMLRLARSEQELGRAVEAQAVLERLLRAAPELRPDPRQFPPGFLALVDDARGRLRALGAATLTIEAPSATRVFVEGRELGVAPVSVELPPGRYRVSGLLGGARSPTLTVELGAPRTVQLDLSLATALRPDAPGLATPDEERRTFVISAAARLGLRRVLVANREERDGLPVLAASLLDVERGRTEREGRVPLAAGAAGVDALADFLITGKVTPPVEAPAAPSLAPTAAEAERALTVGAVAPPPARRRSSALGWTAIATGAAALAAGAVATIYAVEAQRSYDEARGMLGADGKVTPPDTVATYNATLAEGDRRRDAAIGFGVGAGVGAAASLVLGYVSWRLTGEVGPLRF